MSATRRLLLAAAVFASGALAGLAWGVVQLLLDGDLDDVWGDS